jgi:hypothetical protein
MANKSLFPKDTTKVTTTKKADKAKKEDEKVEAASTEDAAAPAVEKPKAEKAKQNGKKKVKATGQMKPKKVSMVDAALKVLASAKEPMSCTDLVDAMTTKGLWTSPGGKTPSNTLYSAFLRLIQTKGKGAAIRKADKGTFEINPSATA